MRSLRPDQESATRIERYGVTLSDLAGLENTVPGLALAAPARRIQRSLRSPSTGGVESPGSVVGTTPLYGLIQGFDDLLEEGHRFLADEDQEQASAVAVLSGETARRLFPGDEPLGQTLVVSGQAFRVVGVLRERPASAVDLGEDVYMPLASLRRRVARISR